MLCDEKRPVVSEGYNGAHVTCIFWLSSVFMLLSICCFEWMYTTFGKVVLSSDIKIASLLFTHMCFFSVFQLFSGALIDHYGSKIWLPVAAFFVFVGMLLQIHTYEHNFSLMMVISQVFLTFGSSFSFIGIGYLSYGFLRKSLAGIMFGLAQMAYSLFYSMSWYLSICYGDYLKLHFIHVVWVITAFQLLLFVVMLCTARNPVVYKPRLCSVKFLETVSSIASITLLPNVVTVSLIGGMEFGLFFAVAGVLLYKANADWGNIASVCAWVGFAIGSPCACGAYALLRKGRKYIFTASGLVQGISFLLLMMLPMQESVALGGAVRIGYCVLSVLFGFFSGGHMVAFSMGSDMGLIGSITTYCAIVNGFMCLLSGAIVLVLTILARYYVLTDLLLVTAAAVIPYYVLLGFVLHRRNST